MHCRIWRGAVVSAACVITACHASIPTVVDNFFTAGAAVEGRVTDFADNPLPGVDVAIAIRPGTSPFSYQPEHATTDATGYFRTAVHRIGSLGIAPNPDTLTAQLVVTANGPQYKMLPNGGFPTDSSFVVKLQFAPHDSEGPIARATIKWTLP
jgi:hypothetical protein